MKRILIILITILLTKTLSFSVTISNQIEIDSIVSTSDIKYANLIFIEHDKLLKENSLLYKQLNNYIVLNSQLERTDSLRIKQIEELNRIYSIQVENLNKEIHKQNKVIKCWKIGGITISVGLILLLLLK